MIRESQNRVGRGALFPAVRRRLRLRLSACIDGQACRFAGLGHAFCLDVGTGVDGDSCEDNALACDDSHWCVEEEGRRLCRPTCSFDTSACANDVPCQFVYGGLGVCTTGVVRDPTGQLARGR